MKIKVKVIGQKLTVTYEKNAREGNIFGAATADGSRGCAVNSFALSMNAGDFFVLNCRCDFE